MLYILAVFLPPLALLLNGQIFSLMLNLVLIPICIILGFFLPLLWLVPSAAWRAGDLHEAGRPQARRIVDAIRRHGPPPGYKP